MIPLVMNVVDKSSIGRDSEENLDGGFKGTVIGCIYFCVYTSSFFMLAFMSLNSSFDSS